MRLRACLAVLAAAMCAAPIMVAPASAASEASTHTTPWRASNVVALGDSFASGEGGQPYEFGTNTGDNQCHRSRTSPIKLYSKMTHRKVQSVACSGATTFNIWRDGKYNEPPQVQQLNRHTRLVFVSIGGNDAGFGKFVGCVLQQNCDTTPLPAATLQFVNGAQFSHQLDRAYDAIKMKAPHANVKVVLYPPLFPRNPHTKCGPVSSQEIWWGNKVEFALNDVIREQARQHGFGVVNAAPLFRGHDVCSKHHSYFYQPGQVPGAAIWHPNLLGRRALAKAMSS